VRLRASVRDVARRASCLAGSLLMRRWGYLAACPTRPRDRDRRTISPGCTCGRPRRAGAVADGAVGDCCLVLGDARVLEQRRGSSIPSAEPFSLRSESMGTFAAPGMCPAPDVLDGTGRPEALSCVLGLGVQRPKRLYAKTMKCVETLLKEAAERLLEARIAELEQHHSADVEKLTLAGLLDGWLEATCGEYGSRPGPPTRASEACTSTPPSAASSPLSSPAPSSPPTTRRSCGATEGRRSPRRPWPTTTR
jgi:hypothetical protein